MKTAAWCSTLFRGAWFTLSALIVVATVERANAAVIISDEFRILNSAGAPIFDSIIQEPNQTIPPEAALTFAGGPDSVPPPIPLIDAIRLPGTSVLVLTEPPGEPLEPGETPIIITGPNGPVVVSDLVLSTLGTQAAAPPFISLVSDGGPDLAELVNLLPTSTQFIQETGQFQDVTGLLPPAVFPGVGPITILVQSDVSVPEPSSILLAVLAGVGLVTWSQCKRRFSKASVDPGL